MTDDPTFPLHTQARRCLDCADPATKLALTAEVARRFDYACCETLDQFRREPLAITRTGQLKGKGDRHEKDDRHRIDDRSRYVLGWTNEAKIEVGVEKNWASSPRRTAARSRMASSRWAA